MVFLLFFAVAGSAPAQIYRWVDPQGRVNFSNSTPPPGAKATVVDADAKAGPAAAARAGLVMKTYTYMPTPADPFTTTVMLVGGRVSEIERIRKF